MQRGRLNKGAADQRKPTTESQQMQALISHFEQLTGDDEEFNKFQEKVRSRKKDLKALLQQRLQQAEQNDVRRRNEISSLIAEALTKPSTPTRRQPSAFPGTRIVGNASHSSVIKVDAACRSMLSEYRNLDAIIEDMAGDNKKPVTEKWMKDVEETERLLKLGHKTAVRNVKKVLYPDAEDAEEEGEKGIGVQEELNMELRDGLRYAERGVKRMVKGLPKDAR
ncbi:hypothetical protein BU23DRAFT_601505 [Bimuria novae-zelandiae CBS 107.79]|uniref:Uncharacterized protein n=1 Tax=Bimuria novae-zelandiae CBS 107.79 TaxID=1447943 RepID=A0A6A5UWJ0_9PLEO|nr:hypothetical protein BU23DRAFT_601505 [Bimuria novae-zelandiae CBS 107.79]